MISETIKNISDQALLNSVTNKDVSLFNGKMGMSCFFFQLSRYTGNHWYEDFAGELLDDVCYNLTNKQPITFSEGLCGIGWGIEYLKANNFIEGDTDEILTEVDLQVMERDVCRITDTSFETGLLGVAAYARSRINTNRISSDTHPFDERYIGNLNRACNKVGIKLDSESLSLTSVWERILKYYSSCAKGEWQKGITLLNKKDE